MIFGATSLAIGFCCIGFVQSKKMSDVPGANELQIRPFNEFKSLAVVKCLSLSAGGSFLVVSQELNTSMLVPAKTILAISVEVNSFPPITQKAVTIL